MTARHRPWVGWRSRSTSSSTPTGCFRVSSQAGVFAFRLPGIITAPLVVALPKALLGAISENHGWSVGTPDRGDRPEAHMVEVEEVVEASAASGAGLPSPPL